MIDTPDPRSLARRYLDLWDRQATAIATDGRWAEVMQHWIAGLDRTASPTAESDYADSEGTETGAEAAATAPDDGADDSAERHRKPAECPRR